MIKDKNELKYYLKKDKEALGITKRNPKLIIGDEIWKFERTLRKCEFYKDKSKIKYLFYKIILKRKSIKLGFSIPENVFGPGLSIAHYGTIVVNSNCKVGKNCRIHENVTLGATNGESQAPQLGDNVFIGTGAKIIGNIYIADDVAIGANAVVVKSINEKGITVGGIPAKKISDNNSHSNLNKLIDFDN